MVSWCRRKGFNWSWVITNKRRDQVLNAMTRSDNSLKDGKKRAVAVRTSICRFQFKQQRSKGKTQTLIYPGNQTKAEFIEWWKGFIVQESKTWSPWNELPKQSIQELNIFSIATRNK
jgi:hypothetical protein